jgi:suppressor of ftsI/bilirubin oxidase
LYEVKSGEAYDYSFTIYNRSGAYWYHPHPMGITALQAYMGIAGLFIVNDENEDRFKRGTGITDEVPILIQDKRFDEQGRLVYSPTMMDTMMGYLGNRIVVNFTLNPYLELYTKIYRLRILNASNARKYKLSFVKSNGEKLPYHIIGTDGGFLEWPIRVREVFLDSAERIDILLDLRNMKKGDAVFLKSERFDPYHMENMVGNHGMMNHGGHGTMSDHGVGSPMALNEGEEFYILRITIKDEVSQDQNLPGELSTIEPLDTGGPIQGESCYPWIA